MTAKGWVLATDARKLGAMVSAVRELGDDVAVVAVGPRAVAEAAAAAKPDRVAWIEAADDVPAEGYAAAVAEVVSVAEPRAVLAATTPQGRALLARAAAALGAVVIPGVVRMSLEGDMVVIDRTELGGRVVETLATGAPVGGLFGGPEIPSPPQPRRHPSRSWPLAAPPTSGS